MDRSADAGDMYNVQLEDSILQDPFFYNLPEENHEYASNSEQRLDRCQCNE